MQLLKPTTETRTKRAPRWLRILQTITAIDALTAKGLEEFGTRDVVNEIDPRMSASTGQHAGRPAGVVSRTRTDHAAGAVALPPLEGEGVVTVHTTPASKKQEQETWSM